MRPILPAMRGGALGSIAAVVLLLACRSFARAQAEPQQTRVSVDWEAVDDADVERCGLSRLRAGTIERLVGAGYAVVEATDDSGVRVSVGSVPGGLKLRIEGKDIAREETLAAGAECDATFALDVISRIAERVDEVAQELARHRAASDVGAGFKPAHSDATHSDAARSDDHPDAPPDRPAVHAGIDLTARINTAPSYQLGGGLGVRASLPAGWELGGRAELTVHAERGVTVLELLLGPAIAWQPEVSGLGAYLEIGPILHLATSDARSVRELDLALGLGPQLGLGPVLVQLLAYGRLRRFEHRVDGETAFDTGHLGLILRAGAQL